LSRTFTAIVDGLQRSTARRVRTLERSERADPHLEVRRLERSERADPHLDIRMRQRNAPRPACSRTGGARTGGCVKGREHPLGRCAFLTSTRAGPAMNAGRSTLRDCSGRHPSSTPGRPLRLTKGREEDPTFRSRHSPSMFLRPAYATVRSRVHRPRVPVRVVTADSGAPPSDRRRSGRDRGPPG
jgi:hypothetical protein